MNILYKQFAVQGSTQIYLNLQKSIEQMINQTRPDIISLNKKTLKRMVQNSLTFLQDNQLRIVYTCFNIKKIFDINLMASQIPATSYSTIFHCDQSGLICILRLFEGLVSVGMFIMFYRGYKAINQERNNKINQKQRWLYLLAMFQTLLLSLYYLIFQEFFMLATIRNFLIWISINVLHIFCILYWTDSDAQKIAQWGMYVLQIINFCLWFFISLGEGSSLVNTDFNLGYNCMIRDWMVMSGILLCINLCIAILGYFKIDKLDFEARQLDEKDKRKINSIAQERTNIIMIICSGVVGSFIMFCWDFLAFNNSVSRQSCEILFSGNSIPRNILCFLLKIITMQFNPSVIYYNIYYCRRQDFQANNEDPLLQNEDGYDPFARGPSVLNLTISERASNRRSDYKSDFGRQQVSNYK